jgi:transposase-like protein
MSRYTPEFLAALRRCYEDTQQSERSIARAFGLANSTFRQIARKERWVRPPQAMRDLEPAMRLLEQATAIVKVSNHQGYDIAPVARIPVTRYTPRLLAALRQRCEQTTKSTLAIAREFGISDRTLRRIASKYGWRRPAPLCRDLEPAARLLEEATALERQYFGRK